MKEIKVRIKFTEPILGGTPMNQEIYRDYVAAKAPVDVEVDDEFEALSAEDAVLKGKTTFPRDENGFPFLFDYHIKGFFKSACGFLRNTGTTKSNALKGYKKKIDGEIFVFPRKIMFEKVQGITECQRPLRAQTPQGERVALAISDEIPEGAEMQFVVEVFNDSYEKFVKEWLGYGIYNGLGQWRNSGMGRFEVISYEVSDKAGFWEK